MKTCCKCGHENQDDANLCTACCCSTWAKPSEDDDEGVPGTLPARATISQILRNIANQRWPVDESFPQDQTQAWAGECGLFVDEAWRPLEKAGIVFADEGMIGKFSQISCAVKPPPGLSLEQVSSLGIEENINHHWLVSDGRHFDASCPDGVDSVFELRGIRQTAAEVLERDHTKLLHSLCSEHDWWRDSVLMLIDFRKQRAAAEAHPPKQAHRPRC
jgi:hypothetical protein